MTLKGSLIDHRPLVSCVGACKRLISQVGAIRLLNGVLCNDCFGTRLRLVASKTAKDAL